MDRILIILKKENGPRASSAPALGLNTIIFKHVYWYMQQTQVSVSGLLSYSSYFFFSFSPLDDPGKNKIRCTPRGTKVAIYHIVGIFMLNSMHNVVSLATCAESL